MTTLYYFIVWSIKNYEYDAIDIIPMGLGSFLLGTAFGVSGFPKIGMIIWIIGGTMVACALIYSIIIRPIQRQYRRFKADQAYMMHELSRKSRNH